MSQNSPATDAQPLLVELLTEELPPKALPKLSTAFASHIHTTLASLNLLDTNATATEYATPRRLAVSFSAVRAQAPEQQFTERLMPKKVGLTDDGQMSAPLQKRLHAKGLDHLTLQDLTIASDGKQDFFYYQGVTPGVRLADGLQQALDDAITHLPIPKVMRYQLSNGESVRFVRPAHGLLALWGDDVVNVQALGMVADRQTAGHRFLGQAQFRLPHANDYETLLKSQGQVIASFTERKQRIAGQLEEAAEKLNAIIGDSPEAAQLLDEVTALVEYPQVYVGEFDQEFLEIPAECLILTMRLNQKYFPLFDRKTHALTNKFLIVSNMQCEDPSNIIEGNERVIRPRLADAKFFFDTDTKIRLEERVSALKNSTYHHALGSQYDRMRRVQGIATWLAQQLGADEDLARRAARLAKADLNSSMVGEFPELQGIMGAHYAQHDGEPQAVVTALAQQYQLRIHEPVTDDTLVATILFIAERVETLVGIWGIGLKPTGERDPFALRRAALGIISAYEQLTAGNFLDTADSRALSVTALLQTSFQQFTQAQLAADTVEDTHAYIVERYRHLLSETIDKRVVDAVLAIHPPLHQVRARIEACKAFLQQHEADSLAEANKRLSNMLRKSEHVDTTIQTHLLQDDAEIALANEIARLQPLADQALQAGQFSDNLRLLADAKPAVDRFFDNVMIMVDDQALRNNRLALLAQLHDLMNQVADISRLAS